MLFSRRTTVNLPLPHPLHWRAGFQYRDLGWGPQSSCLWRRLRDFVRVDHPAGGLRACESRQACTLVGAWERPARGDLVRTPAQSVWAAQSPRPCSLDKCTVMLLDSAGWGRSAWIPQRPREDAAPGVNKKGSWADSCGVRDGGHVLTLPCPHLTPALPPGQQARLWIPLRSPSSR